MCRGTLTIASGTANEPLRQERDTLSLTLQLPLELRHVVCPSHRWAPEAAWGLTPDYKNPIYGTAALLLPQNLTWIDMLCVGTNFVRIDSLHYANGYPSMYIMRKYPNPSKTQCSAHSPWVTAWPFRECLANAITTYLYLALPAS